MLILSLRTDKPEAEIGLYDNEQPVAYETWQAHRQLAETIHGKIQQLLAGHGKQLQDMGGIVAFKGPGSFTGLRIGLTVANALASSLDVPVVSSMGDTWVARGIERLLNGENETIALPEYGTLPNITAQKK